jgi:gamma-butyrobetaine dioxygenase
MAVKHQVIKDGVKIFWGSRSSLFHFSWLRDNCQKLIHPQTKQKLHSSRPVDAEPHTVQFENDKLTIRWKQNSISKGIHSQPYESEYNINWLLKNDYSNPPQKLIKPILTKAIHFEQNYNPIEYSDFLNDDESYKSVLKQLRDYGISFLKNVPLNEREVETVAKRFGAIRDTFYGLSWDVKSIPNSKNIAYTSLELGLHMDLLYFESPPGLQMLHCMENTANGGSSTFLDIYQAVDQLRKESSEHFETLKKVPVTFHYVNDGYNFKFRRPTIVDNEYEDELNIYYSPPFQAPLQAKPELVNSFYEAFGHLESIICQKDNIFKKKLVKGECVIFANRRVLHGRDQFDANSGNRHLRGVYVGWDEFKDRLRINGLAST